MTSALKGLGDYVYAYYSPNEYLPFYVGKGKRTRVINHWKLALKQPPNEKADRETSGTSKKDQVAKIRQILTSSPAAIPVIQIIAYNLETTEKEHVYSVVERTLQSTFGIQKVFDKTTGRDRLMAQQGSLVQVRNDSAQYPPLSLEAAYCKGRNSSSERVEIDEIADANNAPVLLVGLSKTYKPEYRPVDLAEMARMWWNLPHVGKAKFEQLRKSGDAILAAWSSYFGCPQIVGLWRIVPGTFEQHPNPKKSKRWRFEVVPDYNLRQQWLGACLRRGANSYEGPKLAVGKRQGNRDARRR